MMKWWNSMQKEIQVDLDTKQETMRDKTQNKDKRNIKKAAEADQGTGKEQMKAKKFVKNWKISQQKIATSRGQ